MNQAYIAVECAAVTTVAYAVSNLCSEHGVKANCGVETSFTVSTSVTNDCINNPDSATAGWACPSPGVHASDYNCYCNAGYRATADDNGATCANVDICADGLSATDTVDCGQGTCVDNDGSYACDCDLGYELNGDASFCMNIDEYSIDGQICDTGLYLGPYPSTTQNILGVCQDTNESYFCECSDGNLTQTCTNGVFIDPWWNLGNADGSHDFTDVSRCYCACQEPFGFCTNIGQSYSSSEFQSINDNKLLL